MSEWVDRFCKVSYFNPLVCPTTSGIAPSQNLILFKQKRGKNI
jgi:hypothetical protein